MPWFAAAAGAALAIVVSASSCAQRSLVEVDVLGDAPFNAVTLRLIAGGARQDFPRVTFDATTPFKAGLYLPDSVSGNITVVANVLGSGGTCIGSGQASASGVAAGATAGPVSLTVTHTSDCAAPASGAGGSSGTGTGGAPGGGTGGGSSGVGGGASGIGGSSGGGTGGAPGSGTGGMTGTGGQAAGELITNGDFSNGVNSWGLPANSTIGTVTGPTVTNGALCVTLGAASSTTIGYPSGGTPPFQLNAGATYRFSYQASLSPSGGTTIEAKIGQTVTPYSAIGSDFTNEPIGTSLQTVTHMFTRASSDSSMGVAFNIMGGPATFCIDNVSLTPN
jgi:hypothetical protein